MEEQTYITPAGKAELEAELKKLKLEARPLIAAKIHRAKEFGEMPEGGEFDEAKNEQAFIEGRIEEIEEVLKKARVVLDHDREVVSLGGFVRVKGEDGKQAVYNIVGAAEIAPENGKISNESPIGRALLGKKVGDMAIVVAPGGRFSYKILKVW